jgi:hypothetical protein
MKHGKLILEEALVDAAFTGAKNKELLCRAHPPQQGHQDRRYRR